VAGHGGGGKAVFERRRAACGGKAVFERRRAAGGGTGVFGRRRAAGGGAGGAARGAVGRGGRRRAAGGVRDMWAQVQPSLDGQARQGALLHTASPLYPATAAFRSAQPLYTRPLRATRRSARRCSRASARPWTSLRCAPRELTMPSSSRSAPVQSGRASLPRPVQTGRASLPRPVQTGRASLPNARPPHHHRPSAKQVETRGVLERERGPAGRGRGASSDGAGRTGRSRSFASARRRPRPRAAAGGRPRPPATTTCRSASPAQALRPLPPPLPPRHLSPALLTPRSPPAPTTLPLLQRNCPAIHCGFHNGHRLSHGPASISYSQRLLPICGIYFLFSAPEFLFVASISYSQRLLPICRLRRRQLESQVGGVPRGDAQRPQDRRRPGTTRRPDLAVSLAVVPAGGCARRQTAPAVFSRAAANKDEAA
jgi:hypothetical protein